MITCNKEGSDASKEEMAAAASEPRNGIAESRRTGVCFTFLISLGTGGLGLEVPLTSCWNVGGHVGHRSLTASLTDSLMNLQKFFLFLLLRLTYYDKPKIHICN